MQRLLIFAAMGIEIGALIYGAFLLGRYLDQTYQTKGLIFAALALMLLAGWLTQVIVMARRFQRQDELAEKLSKGDSPSGPSL